MKILFIYPNFTDMRSADAMPPLAFGILAALTPPDIEVRLMDDRVEAIDLDDTADLAALSVQTFTAKRAYHIADRLRARGIPVVMGGFHATLVPEEAAAHADSLVLGEAEAVWPQVVADSRRGALRKVYRAEKSWECRGIVTDRSIFKGKKYSSLVPVQFGRGCRHRCNFCSVHSFYGREIRHRPVEEMIREIAAIEERLLFFVDDNFTTDPVKAKALCKALRPLKRHWACQVSIEAAQDEELIALMAAGGCLAVFMGFESFDTKNLRTMHKAQNIRSAAYPAVVRQFKHHGIMVTGSFVFGNDHDTEAAFEAAFTFAMHSRLCLSHFNPLFPTPGSKLYAALEKEKRLIYDKWWLDDRYRYGDLQFYPGKLSPQWITDKCYELRRRFNTLPAILARSLDFKANARSPLHLGIYLMANLLSRKEIYKKQGIKLG